MQTLRMYTYASAEIFYDVLWYLLRLSRKVNFIFIIIVVFVVGFSHKLRVRDLYQHKFCFCQDKLDAPWSPTRGGISLYKPYGYVPHRLVGFLRRFGLKPGIHFAHFGLESGWVFEGTTAVYEHFYRFNSKWVRKKEKYANSK